VRHDMKKLLCERPRIGHSLPSHKTGKRLNPNLDWESGEFDWGPPRLSSGRRLQERNGIAHKSLNDYLSPLERFYHSALGRDWDSVYSEIRQNIDDRSMSGNHLLGHVKSSVQTAIEMENGKPYSTRYSSRRHPNYCYTGYYVNPETGLLCEHREPSYRRRMRERNSRVETLRFDGGRYVLLHICKASDGCRRNILQSEDPHWIRQDRPENQNCVHKKQYRILQSIWFVEEFGYHDPEEPYNIITYESSSLECTRLRYNLREPGDRYIIRYKDVPEHQMFVKPKRQANRKELKIIRGMLQAW
jgi:hypothetical protein